MPFFDCLFSLVLILSFETLSCYVYILHDDMDEINKRTRLFDIDFAENYDREMEKKCSVDGCDNKVTAKGMCSKHYQKFRRENPSKMGKAGRPRQYSKELSAKYQGAPTMSVRMDPELLGWVKSRGGSTWMRYVAGELRELADDPDFQTWKSRFRLDDQE